MDDESFAIMITVRCENEEQAARAIEAFSRPMAGLILDGQMCSLGRIDPDM